MMDFPSDRRVADVSDAYMFGPSLLVAPVYEYGARSREVYFPECEGWYDFYTNKYMGGGVSVRVSAPYERIPLYVRAGSIIPAGPQMQWSDEKPADDITIYVYKGADGKFTLYEDEGVNYNYEKGLYSMIDFIYDDDSSTLVIGSRQGAFPGMIGERTFRVLAVSPSGSRAFGPVRYAGDSITLQL